LQIAEINLKIMYFILVEWFLVSQKLKIVCYPIKRIMVVDG